LRVGVRWRFSAAEQNAAIMRNKAAFEQTENAFPITGIASSKSTNDPTQ
jgi:hypothetical protein